MTQVVALQSATIPNGSAVSNIIDSAKNYTGLNQIILIQAPAALDALTFTIQVSNDGITFTTLTSDGTTALTLPGAGKAKPYYFELAAAKYWRIASSGNVAADRVFLVSGNEGAC